MLSGLGETVCRRWREPDEGIWEGRAGRFHHTHSKVLCWVALDRLIALHDTGRLRIDRDRFRSERDAIRTAIEAQGTTRASTAIPACLTATIWMQACSRYRSTATTRAPTHGCVRPASASTSAWLVMASSIAIRRMTGYRPARAPSASAASGPSSAGRGAVTWKGLPKPLNDSSRAPTTLGSSARRSTRRRSRAREFPTGIHPRWPDQCGAHFGRMRSATVSRRQPQSHVRHQGGLMMNRAASRSGGSSAPSC